MIGGVWCGEKLNKVNCKLMIKNKFVNYCFFLFFFLMKIWQKKIIFMNMLYEKRRFVGILMWVILTL